MAPAPRGRLRRAIFSVGASELSVTVVLKSGLSGPPLPFRIEASDMAFVLKCKVECALRLLNETQAGSVGRVATAEDIELEYRGVPMRDMTTIERYSVDHGSEIVALYRPRPPERDTVPREPDFHHLDKLVMNDPGVPSTGMLKRLVSQYGRRCQISWRGRWFRAEILSIYSTSILLGWIDWPDAEWPHFFIHVALAAAPGMLPAETDETWRIRWHREMPNSEMPIVQPRYRELPPLNWVKAFLRTYATTDESTMLREIQASLPKELVEARQMAASRHRCLVLGASGVGKSTLIRAFLAGAPTANGGGGLGLEGLQAAVTGGAFGSARDEYGGGGARAKYWPTVGTKSAHGEVRTPGLAPLALEVYDTSGNPRFKPLSLVFYRQAQSVILVFDVKSMASFRALGAVGGWLHEFTRLTGCSPRNFPFVLVGNKADGDVMHPRQVEEHDVRSWRYTDGGRMPYIETSFGGDPKADWRHAEHVFRTVARAAHHVKENLGRHRPPETVRVPEEPDYEEEDYYALHGGSSFVAAKSFAKAAPALWKVGALTEQLADNVRKGFSDAAKAGEEWLTCGKRSVDKAFRSRGHDVSGGAPAAAAEPGVKQADTGHVGRSTALVVAEGEQQ